MLYVIEAVLNMIGVYNILIIEVYPKSWVYFQFKLY